MDTFETTLSDVTNAIHNEFVDTCNGTKLCGVLTGMVSDRVREFIPAHFGHFSEMELWRAVLAVLDDMREFELELGDVIDGSAWEFYIKNKAVCDKALEYFGCEFYARSINEAVGYAVQSHVETLWNDLLDGLEDLAGAMSQKMVFRVPNWGHEVRVYESLHGGVCVETYGASVIVDRAGEVARLARGGDKELALAAGYALWKRANAA